MNQKEILEKILNDSREYDIKYFRKLFYSLDSIFQENEEIKPECIEYIYYAAYFILFNSLKLEMDDTDQINSYLKKSAEYLSLLSDLDYNKFNSDELIFDSLIIYYISNNYPNAYVLSKENKNLNLPTYKEAIFKFINKDFNNLRIQIFKELNSKDMDEDLIISELEDGNIDKYDALSRMLSYPIFFSLNCVLNYIYLGEEIFINEAIICLNKYEKIALNHGMIDFWWMIKVLRIIINEFYDNSLWKNAKKLNKTNNFSKLKEYILNYANQDVPIVELWPSQIQSIDPIVENEDNLVIKMPTSAGKTLIAELSILNYFTNESFDKKVVYISPYRALSNEIEQTFRNSLGKIGFMISNFYGGFEYNLHDEDFVENCDILILTPEKFDTLIRSNNNIMENIGLIILDEGHIIGNPEGKYFRTIDKRSLNLEFFILRIKNLFPHVRLIFISGVLPNIEDFSKWLCENPNNLLESDWRPTNLSIGTLIWNKDDGGFIRLYYKKDNKYRLLPNKIKFREIYKDKNLLSDFHRKYFPRKSNEALAVSSLIFANEAPTFVFSPDKKQIKKLSKTIIDIKSIFDFLERDSWLVYNKNDEDIIKLKTSIINELGKENLLYECFKNGFLFHHADLPENVKLNIENVLKKGKISLIIGTSTLIQGINFPIKTILIKSLYINKNSEGESKSYNHLMDSSTFFNMCGRAGRAGYENKGRVLLVIDEINGSKNKVKRDFRKLLNTSSNVTSVFFQILSKLKDYYKKEYSYLNFEEFCMNLSNNLIDFSNEEDFLIDLIDTGLLAFVEESDEKEDVTYLLNQFINNSLYPIQSNNKSIIFESFLLSRLNYLKNQYSANFRRKMYKMGLNLMDCRIIEDNKDKLVKYLSIAENWQSLDISEKNKLLLDIAKFISELNISKDDEFDEMVIKYWIEGYQVNEIFKLLNNNYEFNKINRIINSYKWLTPWGLNGIITFLKDENYFIPDVFNYFSDMFKYGIFDYKNILLLSYCNYDFDLYKYLLGFDFDYENLEELEKAIKNLNNNENNNLLSKNNIIKHYENDNKFDESERRIIVERFYEKFNSFNNLFMFILVENKLLLFSLDGELIKKFKKIEYKLENLKLNEINLNTFWQLKKENNRFIFYLE